MAENYQNQNDQKKHVTTSNNTYTNGNAEVPSALVVSYYDDSVRLSFVPELPENEKTEKRRYNYDKPVMTALYRAKCQELYNAYKEKIVPAIKEGRSEQVSIPLASVNQLMIDTNVDANGVPRPKLKLIKNIDPVTLIAAEDNVVSYEFNTGEYILGYNEETGDFKERIITYNELDLFMNDLRLAADATSNAYVHTDRVVNKYWKDSLDSKLVRIGEANGLDLSYRPKYSNGNGGQGSIFNSAPKSNTTNDLPYASNVSVKDLDALENEIAR